MNDAIPVTGFEIASLSLVSCYFRWGDEPSDRDDSITTVVQGALKLKLSLSVERSEEESDEPCVIVKGKLRGVANSEVAWFASVAYGAVLRIAATSSVPKDTLLRINAPAILYAYIREHLADLTRRAEITGVVLPPMRFAPYEGSMTIAGDEPAPAPGSTATTVDASTDVPEN